MRTAFVTGARGLIGSWLVTGLVERGVRVVVLDRRPDASSPGVTTVYGDLLDAGLLLRTLDEHAVDSVFHLAAQSTAGAAREDPAATFETNVRGTWLLLDACRAHGAERVLVASTDRVYGAPPSARLTEELPLNGRQPYDASKAAADLLARSSAFDPVPVAVLRTTNIYGGGDRNRSRLVPELVGAALTGRGAVIHTDGSPERRHLYVEDAVAAYLAVADRLGRRDPIDANLGGVDQVSAFNVGGERLYSIRDVAERVRVLSGSGAAPDYRGTPVPADRIDRLDLDSSKLRSATGWAPRVDLDEGLRRTLDWYRAHPEVLA